jgi:hypothetical protein
VKIRRRIHVPKPIPPRVWRECIGWWLALSKPDGTKVVHTGFRTREEAIDERDNAMKSGAFEKAWIGEMMEPSKRRRNR